MLAERDHPQADIDRQASAWLARRRLTRLSAAEEAEFAAWCAADPRHAATFEEMSVTLEDVAALRSLAALEPLTPAPRGPFRLMGAVRRRSTASVLGALAATLAAVVIVPALADRPDIEASTLVAEIRPITLPDGTKVTLGGKSQIKVRFDGRERRVELTDGEAFFEIAQDAARPFVVDAGGTVIRDIGTKFEVKRNDGRVEVGVLEGAVEVRPTSLLRGDVVRRLAAGQRVRGEESGFGPILASAQLGAVEKTPAAAGAWRQGQLTYDDAPLSAVVADLNRYYAPGVRLDSASLGDARLAAAFKVHEIDKFLAELPSVAPVVVSRDAAGAVTISGRPRDTAGG